MARIARTRRGKSLSSLCTRPLSAKSTCEAMSVVCWLDAQYEKLSATPVSPKSTALVARGPDVADRVCPRRQPHAHLPRPAVGPEVIRDEANRRRRRLWTRDIPRLAGEGDGAVVERLVERDAEVACRVDQHAEDVAIG